jgi:hypothetical protein
MRMGSRCFETARLARYFWVPPKKNKRLGKLYPNLPRGGARRGAVSFMAHARNLAQYDFEADANDMTLFSQARTRVTTLRLHSQPPPPCQPPFPPSRCKTAPPPSSCRKCSCESHAHPKQTPAMFSLWAAPLFRQETCVLGRARFQVGRHSPQHLSQLKIRVSA